MSDQFDTHDKLLENLIQCVAYLEEGNTTLKNRQVDSENRDKRSNLVLIGVPEDVIDSKLSDFFSRICKENLNLIKPVQLDRIHRVSVKGDSRVRNVVIKFHSYSDRQLVWENRRLLKGTKLFLDEHFALEVQVKWRILLPFLQAARRRGEKCFLHINSLIISGRRFTTSPQDLRSLELRYADCVRSRSEREVQDEAGNTILGFFGKFSPLSNFAAADFEISGQKFTSVEQFYSYKKCELNGKKDLAFRVMKAEQPAQTTAISRGLKLDDETRVEVVRSGLLAKFHQNQNLRDYLVKTGTKILTECNPQDKFWGAACPLRSDKLANPSSWPGLNKLGVLLMDIREELKAG